MTFAENRSRWIIHELVVYVALVCIIHITTMEICSFFVTLVPKTVHRWPCNMSKKIDACLWLVFYFTQADPNLFWKLWNAYSTEVFWIFFNFFCNRCKKSQLIMRSYSNMYFKIIGKDRRKVPGRVSTNSFTSIKPNPKKLWNAYRPQDWRVHEKISDSFTHQTARIQLSIAFRMCVLDFQNYYSIQQKNHSVQ